MTSIEYQGRRYGVETGESVLEALLRQGVQVRHSCRKGSCQTCLMKCERGEVSHRRAIDHAVESGGHILSCVAVPRGDLVLAVPDVEWQSIPAEVVERRDRAADIVELWIAPAQPLNLLNGKHVHLLRPDGLSRPYSIAGCATSSGAFAIHVRRVPGGAMSPWLCDVIRPGQMLRVGQPSGDCSYRPAMRGRPMLLLATGSGGGALAAVARDALQADPATSIDLYHGVRRAADLYLQAELEQLARQYPHFRPVACVSGETPPAGICAGRITDAAMADYIDLSEVEIFLCGSPSMIEEARYRVVLAGARRERIHADAFASVHLPQPRDAEKIAHIAADPELWLALDRGPGLTRILTAFYDRVYEDDRLAPYFTGVSKAFVIQKQYDSSPTCSRGRTAISVSTRTTRIIGWSFPTTCSIIVKRCSRRRCANTACLRR